MTKLSQLISWVFLPLLMPIYGILLLMFVPFDEIQSTQIPAFALPLNIKWIVVALFAMFSFVAPGLSFLLLFRMKVISTIDIENRRERFYPLIITLMYSVMLYWLLLQSDPDRFLPSYFSRLALSAVWVTVLFMAITKVYKVSMHTGGAGIFTGFLYAFFQQVHNPSIWWLCFALLVSGGVFAARWYLNKHTAGQLLLGYFLAFTITVFTVVGLF
ncbi:MAG: hypothetical protein EB023_14265 [Flavobacteriia bacterium]|nr:hypothetical protein [Flavobacteriia bacterium]